MSRRGFKKVIKSMRGVAVDMEALMAANEDIVALGNGRMNARGDRVGRSGRIEVRREQLTKDYHSNHSMSVSLKPVTPDVFMSPSEALAQMQQAVAPVKTAAPVKSSELDKPAELAPRRSRRLEEDAE